MTTPNDFLQETFDSLRPQLEADNLRWGDTWKQRGREGQEARIKQKFLDYFDQYENAGTPVPWLKIMGLAHIALIRENHPEVLENESN